MENVGGLSSLVIVPVPSASNIDAPLAPDNCTVNASSFSNCVSPLTSTVISLVVSVGSKLSLALLD